MVDKRRMIGAGVIGGGTGTFDPGNIPGMFTRLDHLSAIYQDQAGTTPAVSNNDPVKLWLDGTATQNATATTGFVLKTGVNGINGVNALFCSGNTGVDTNSLDLTGLTVALGPYTFYFVVSPDILTGQPRYLLDITTGRLILCHLTDTVGKTGFYDGAFKSIADATTGAQILTYTFNSSSNQAEMFRNGVSLGTAAYTPKAISGVIRIGARNTASSAERFSGLYGAVYGYSGLHNSGQRSQVEGYLTSVFFP